jgi:hypothetical protein
MSVEDDQFDALFAEIMAEGDSKMAAVAEEPAVVAPMAEARETLIANLVAVEEPAVVAPKTERKEYKTVDKVDVEGGPLPSKVYPLGYLSVSIPGFRFANKAVFYRDDFHKFVDFLRDSAKSDPWLASLDAAGFRNRGEAKKEG